jgi:hypothetical protein
VVFCFCQGYRFEQRELSKPGPKISANIHGLLLYDKYKDYEKSIKSALCQHMLFDGLKQWQML